MNLNKVFRTLYLLNMWMYLTDTLPPVRYWSKVLCCTILTHLGDLEVKVTWTLKIDFNNITDKAQVAKHKSGELIDPA